MRTLQSKEYDHLLDLWAIRLDEPRNTNYYQPLLERYRKANRSKKVTAEQWSNLAASKVGDKGKQFLRDTPKIVQVRMRMHVCYVNSAVHTE